MADYTPSPQATLILRLAKTPGHDDQPGEASEYWYEPSDRSVHELLVETYSDNSYSLDPAVIIDRWCVDPGTPPYREMRVTHAGVRSMNVTFTPVDNVTACQAPPCTLGVTLTAGAVHDGRGYLTAQVTGAQGAVLLSLDGFRSAGVAPDSTGAYEFGPYRPGAYTVTAQESRAGGCRATASATLTASYNPRYRIGFKDRDNAACEALIYQREYAGEVEDLGHAQAEPVVLDWPGGATDHLFTQLLRGSACQLALRLTRTGQLLPLFSGDERLHRVHVRRLGAELWRGYLLPEQYDVAFLAPPNDFNLSATDGLGTLSDLPFVDSLGATLRGDWPLQQVLQFVLGKLDLDLPLYVRCNLYPAGAVTSRPALEQSLVDVAAFQDEKGKAFDCGRVLTDILTAFQARLYQWAGAWWLERLSELSLLPMRYLAYAADGTRGADVVREPLVSIVGPTAGRPYWQGAIQRQGLRPAVASVTVEAAAGDLVNLLAFALPTNDQLAAQGQAPTAVPAGWHASSSPSAFSQLLFSGRDKAPLLRLLGSPARANGYANAAEFDAALGSQPYLDTPLTPPLPLPFGTLGAREAEGLYLRFTVKAYGYTPGTTPTTTATLAVALHYGTSWLHPNLTGPDSVTPVLLKVPLNDSQEIEVEFNGFGTSQTGRQPVYVRFFTPLGSATAATVDITDLRLQYESSYAEEAEGYTDEYTTDTGLFVSRQDKDLSLFHADTPHGRRQGTLLNELSQPVAGWFETTSPLQLREVGDYLVASRALWQRVPAQVLTGNLRGPLAAGLGTLLTDGAEARPAVYVLGPATYRVAKGEWQVTGVQDAVLVAPTADIPDGAILYETGDFWQAEVGDLLLYESAYS